MINKQFTGIFKIELDHYVRYKQSLGYYKDLKEKTIYKILTLNKYLDSFNLDRIMITQEMAEKYLEQFSGKMAQSTIHQHECLFRQFSIFLKNQGYKDIYIFYDCQVKMPRDFIPYVFSDEEIKRIFSVIDHLEFKHNPNITVFYQTFFRLLYCTGLRLGEALNLKVEDIDLENNIIKIYSGKGDVSRIVPFKSTLNIWLSYYSKIFYKTGKVYFFQSPYRTGKRSQTSIGEIFRNKILPKADIHSINQINHRRGVCIHSFRHTFACNALDQMIKEGKKTYCALPYLSVYLGHTSIVNTELYLRLTIQRHDEVINAGHYIYEESIGDLNE